MKVDLEFSDTSTILEVVSIGYDNKVAIYDDYYDDMYAIKSNKFSMLVHHEKSDVCDSYIVESIHDASEIIMREELMLLHISIISSFFSMC